MNQLLIECIHESIQSRYILDILYCRGLKVWPWEAQRFYQEDLLIKRVSGPVILLQFHAGSLRNVVSYELHSYTSSQAHVLHTFEKVSSFF